MQHKAAACRAALLAEGMAVLLMPSAGYGGNLEFLHGLANLIFIVHQIMPADRTPRRFNVRPKGQHILMNHPTCEALG